MFLVARTSVGYDPVFGHITSHHIGKPHHISQDAFQQIFGFLKIPKSASTHEPAQPPPEKTGRPSSQDTPCQKKNIFISIIKFSKTRAKIKKEFYFLFFNFFYFSSPSSPPWPPSVSRAHGLLPLSLKGSFIHLYSTKKHELEWYEFSFDFFLLSLLSPSTGLPRKHWRGSLITPFCTFFFVFHCLCFFHPSCSLISFSDICLKH